MDGTDILKMADTYSQIYIHIIFAVQKRQYLLQKPWQQEIYKYITEIISSKGQKLIAINGMEDHIHIFVGLKPDFRVSDLVRDIKNNSTKFINSKNWLPFNFAWQKGYGAFSHSHSQVEKVYHYILNQEIHHSKKSFKEEYLEVLRRFNVEHNEKYIINENEN